MKLVEMPQKSAPLEKGKGKAERIERNVMEEAVLPDGDGVVRGCGAS